MVTTQMTAPVVGGGCRIRLCPLPIRAGVRLPIEPIEE